MKIKIFIKNTIILVVTALLLRSIGIVFRVYLADKIGPEGMGLYQLIFSVYMLAATFATTGLSTAVTRLVAETQGKGKNAVKKIMTTTTLLTLVISFVSSVLVFFFSEQIAVFWIKDTRSVSALKILSFSLPFMGISSLIRGYFIARRKTIQPSLVQLFEQVIRIGVIMLCLVKSSDHSITHSATAVLFGDTVAEVASCLLHVILYYKDKNKLSKGGFVSNVLHDTLRISLPLSGIGYMSTALHTAENLLVPIRLRLFYGIKERGLELYGAIRGMAMPILFFPASFLTSLSTMLIPEISEANAAGRKPEVRSTVSNSLKITFSLSVFVGSCFLFWAEEIGMAIYKSSDVGYIIRVLSPIIPFMYMESVAVGILKGLDRQLSMFGYNLFDSITRIVTVFFLLPKFGINGYLVIMIVSNSLTSSLCCKKLLTTAEISFDLKNWVLIPLFVSLVFGIIGRLLFGGINNLYIKLILGILFSTLSFCLFAIIKESKSITKTTLKTFKKQNNLC